MKLIIVALLLMSSKVWAADSHEDLVHLTAHVGASYALQTIFYGINNKTLKLDKADSEVLAFVSTMAVGYLYKLSENAPAAEVGRSMAENALGSLLAIGTHVSFHF